MWKELPPKRINPMSILHVFVVEDQFEVGLDLQCMLSDPGFQVIGPVTTLNDAMAVVEQGGFHAAVLDANLNGCNAGPVASKLRDQHIPFVVVSGYDQPCLPLAVADAPRMAKPFDGARLIATLQQICRDTPGLPGRLAKKDSEKSLGYGAPDSA